MTAPRIIVDTREQDPLEPWRKRDANGPIPLATVTATLATGDYSVEGLEQWVAVERKSIPDLYGTLFGRSGETSSGEARENQERFRRELERLRGILWAGGRALVLVEGCSHDLDAYIAAEQRGVSALNAHSLIVSLFGDYGVPFVWAGGRSRTEARLRAGHMLGTLLDRMAAQATDAKEAKKAAGRGLVLPWAWKES
jgi:hypothetical protein